MPTPCTLEVVRLGLLNKKIVITFAMVPAIPLIPLWMVKVERLGSRVGKHDYNKMRPIFAGHCQSKLSVIFLFFFGG